MTTLLFSERRRLTNFPQPNYKKSDFDFPCSVLTSRLVLSDALGHDGGRLGEVGLHQLLGRCSSRILLRHRRRYHHGREKQRGGGEADLQQPSPHCAALHRRLSSRKRFHLKLKPEIKDMRALVTQHAT